MSKFALRTLLANWQDATQHERKALERKVPGALGKLQPVLKQLATELESQVRQRTERTERMGAAPTAARPEPSKKQPLTSRSGVSAAGAKPSARTAPGTPQKQVATTRSTRRETTPTRPTKRQTAPNTPLPTPRTPLPQRQQKQQPSSEDFEPWSRPPSPIHPPSELPTLELYTGRWLDTSDDSLLMSSMYELEPLRLRDSADDDEASPEAQAISVISELVQLRQQMDAAALHLAQAACLQQSALQAPCDDECRKSVTASVACVQTALRDLNAAKECNAAAETAAHKLFGTLLAQAPSSPATETGSSCGPSDGACSEDLEVSYNASDLQLLVVQGTPYEQLSRPITPPAAIHGEDYALADSSLYYSSARWSC